MKVEPPSQGLPKVLCLVAESEDDKNLIFDIYTRILQELSKKTDKITLPPPNTGPSNVKK
jgi:hypothetical protein